MADELEYLVVTDENYNDTAGSYTRESGEFEQCFTDYLNTLQEILDEELILGKKAEKIQEFISFVKQYLSGKLSGVTSAQTRQMANYLSEIDVADDILY